MHPIFFVLAFYLASLATASYALLAQRESSKKAARASVGFVVSTLVFLWISAQYGATYPIGIDAGERWARLHLLFSFLGVAVVTVSTLMGLLYLLKDYGLKHKRWAVIDAFPPLDRLYFFSKFCCGSDFSALQSAF